MKKVMKRAWLKALRSGEYKQGIEYLVQCNGKNKYCCLGVLLHLNGGMEEIIKHQDEDEEVIATSIYGDDDAIDHPRRDKYGLDDDIHHKLVSMNDHGSTFNVIADYIEENVKEEDNGDK